MLECEGESVCACVCESVSEKEDPRSLFITIITRHHRHHLFNQYIDIQVYIYIARQFFLCETSASQIQCGPDFPCHKLQRPHTCRPWPSTLGFGHQAHPDHSALRMLIHERLFEALCIVEDPRKHTLVGYFRQIAHAVVAAALPEL